MHDRYRASTLTVAVTGGDVLPSQSEFLPRGVRGIAAAAIGAARAGATSVHLHVRDDEGRPSASPHDFQEIVEAIRAESDVVINMSTGGAPGMTLDERLAAIGVVKPDICTFNLGTMNYEGFPVEARWPQVTSDWEREVLANAGHGVFKNTLAMLREAAAAARDAGVTPELEAYDLGHLNMARFLIDEGTLQGPVRIQFVLGILGGAGHDIEDLFVLRDRAHHILGDRLGDLGVAAVGYPMQFRHAAVALALGMDSRVGMEDSLRVRRDQPARDNAEMVRIALGLAESIGRPIASPAELRSRLTAWN
ncbi:MAG: 3-keto-5-aminohexanoate cleavage protein [Actinobacteria bacterium]|nr:3-keto-5-aminohexanoate cleavage protein [Actinomycetota bacterium]